MGNESGYIKGWIDHYQFEHAVFSDYLVEWLEFLHKNRLYNVFSIIDEIKYLEGKSTITATKKEEPFNKYEPLKKFWHKHHFQAKFISRNLINFCQLDHRKSKIFDELWNQLSEETGSDEIDEPFINKLTYELVHMGFMKRMQEHKVTGEWIVYAKHDDKNYYLALAYHKEKNEMLYRRLVDNCGKQFPFLFESK